VQLDRPEQRELLDRLGLQVLTDQQERPEHLGLPVRQALLDQLVRRGQQELQGLQEQNHRPEPRLFQLPEATRHQLAAELLDR